MAEENVGAALPHSLGHQVEVVVLDHHQRPPAARLDLVGYRVGEDVVDRDVALIEGVALGLGEDR